jgi:hypothetical protein
MRWLLRPSEVRSRYSCTTYLASGKCKTSSIPLSPPTAADSLATGPTAPNTPPSADNTLLNRSSRTVRMLDFTPFPLLRIPLPWKLPSSHHPKLLVALVTKIPVAWVHRGVCRTRSSTPQVSVTSGLSSENGAQRVRPNVFPGKSDEGS